MLEAVVFTVMLAIPVSFALVALYNAENHDV